MVILLILPFYFGSGRIADFDRHFWMGVNMKMQKFIKKNTQSWFLIDDLPFLGDPCVFLIFYAIGIVFLSHISMKWSQTLREGKFTT